MSAAEGEALFAVARLSSISSSLFQSASERVGPSNYTEQPPPPPLPLQHASTGDCHSPFDTQQEGIVAFSSSSALSPTTLNASRWTFLSLILTETHGERRKKNGAALKEKMQVSQVSVSRPPCSGCIYARGFDWSFCLRRLRCAASSQIAVQLRWTHVRAGVASQIIAHFHFYVSRSDRGTLVPGLLCGSDARSLIPHLSLPSSPNFREGQWRFCSACAAV